VSPRRRLRRPPPTQGPRLRAPDPADEPPDQHPPLFSLRYLDRGRYGLAACQQREKAALHIREGKYGPVMVGKGEHEGRGGGGGPTRFAHDRSPHGSPVCPALPGPCRVGQSRRCGSGTISASAPPLSPSVPPLSTSVPTLSIAAPALSTSALRGEGTVRGGSSRLLRAPDTAPSAATTPGRTCACLPYGQKTQTPLSHSVYDPAITRSTS